MGSEGTTRLVNSYRHMYWYSIATTVPDLLERLATDVFPSFKSLIEKHHPYPSDFIYWEYLLNRKSDSEQHQELFTKMSEWAASDTWTIKEVWILDIALLNLRLWTSNETAFLNRYIYYQRAISVVEIPQHLRTFSVTLSPHALAWETYHANHTVIDSPEDIKALLVDAFEEELEAYMLQIHKVFAQDKAARDTRKNTEHFEWLCRYHVQRWSIDKVARHYHKGKKTVQDAINSACELLSIDRNKIKKKPGRPNK